MLEPVIPRLRRLAASRINPRLSLAIVAAHAASAASAILWRGGTSLPGLVSLRIEPDCVRLLAGQLGDGSIVVAGTNGKTTTSALIADALRAGGKRVLHNRAGSNMARGIATTLARESGIAGNVKAASRLTGLFEVDEATLPGLLAQVTPRVLVLTNLFRDQLDRYGELATTAERWGEAIRRLPSNTTLVLNADDPLVASLADSAPGAVYYYGISSWIGAQAGSSLLIPALSADSLYCPRCATGLEFSAIAYAHLGQYACPSCGFSRPVTQLDVVVRECDVESSVLTYSSGGVTSQCELHLPGRYNAYNASAAVAAAIVAGVPLPLATKAISGSRGAFGRAERANVDGHDVRLFLIKNPTGADEVFRVVGAGDRDATLVLLLSDNAADGEDISWIWDAQLELLVPWTGPVLCGGTRAEDMALRLKYAGDERNSTVVPGDVGLAVRRAVEKAGSGKPVTILATYTAMLAARAELARGGHVEQYWRTRQ